MKNIFHLAPFALLFTLLALHPQTLFAMTLAQRGSEKVDLIEVYSSEGCSSCVPAWTWLEKAEQDPELWDSFVPVDFHVDYWDYLGWKDPFARHEFTQRQRNYSRQWKTQSVYTPGFVLNGKEWRNWYNQPRTISSADQHPGNLKIDQTKADLYRITFMPKEKKNDLWAHVVLLGFDIKSAVKAGENHGRLIKHNFAVLDYRRKELKLNPGGILEAEVSFKSPQELTSPRQAVAAWVSTQNDSTPLQATGGYLK